MLNKTNLIIENMEKNINKDSKININSDIKVGVDLGTSDIVITVLDKDNNPICAEMYYANAVRDGVVVDFLNAVNILQELKGNIEKKLSLDISKTATAIPPGISKGNIKVIKNVVEASGIEVSNIVDEPTAAATLLDIKNGAVVDVGGGTTGISILKNGEVVYTADEATGGTHLSLVLAGAYGISFEEAEKFKVKKENYNKVFPLVIPVIEKMADIIKRHIKNYDVEEVYLVGGTCCIKDMEKIIENYIGIKCIKSTNPLLVTPIGIAMNAEIIKR